MKKLIIFTSFILASVSSFAQGGQVKNNIVSFDFKLKDGATINIGSLSDGNHSYTSTSGIQMTLTIKKAQVVGSKIIYPNSLQVSKGISDALKSGLARSCQSCINVPSSSPKEGPSRVCFEVACPDPGKINSQL